MSRQITHPLDAELNFTNPEWQPLIDWLSARFSRMSPDDFMWMHSRPFDADVTIHSYKHRDTRHYVHLGTDSSQWSYDSERHSYTETVPPREIIARF